MQEVRDTQRKMILTHLQSGRTLSVAQALTQYGIYALSQRIGELKRNGFPQIRTTMIKNGQKRYAEYSML